MPWQEQNPLNALLGNIVGGLAANRQAQTEAMMRQYQLQRQQQLDADKHSLDQSEIGKNTAEGTRYTAQTANENQETVRKNVEYGIGADGKSSLPPLALPAPGKDGSPPPIAATLAAIRQAQVRALQQGATQIASGYEGVASGLAQQANQEAARAEKAIQDQAQRENWSQQRINQARQIAVSTLNAKISAQGRIQAAAVGAGSIAGAMRANNIDTNNTRVSEGAKNRDQSQTLQNVRDANQFSRMQYSQGQQNSRATAGAANAGSREVTGVQAANPNAKVAQPQIYSPSDFSPSNASGNIDDDSTSLLKLPF